MQSLAKSSVEELNGLLIPGALSPDPDSDLIGTGEINVFPQSPVKGLSHKIDLAFDDIYG